MEQVTEYRKEVEVLEKGIQKKVWCTFSLTKSQYESMPLETRKTFIPVVAEKEVKQKASELD